MLQPSSIRAPVTQEVTPQGPGTDPVVLSTLWSPQEKDVPLAGGSPHPEIGRLEKVAKVPSGCCTLGAGKAQVMGNGMQWDISGHRDRIVSWAQGRAHWIPFLALWGPLPSCLQTTYTKARFPAVSHFRAPRDLSEQAVCRFRDGETEARHGNRTNSHQGSGTSCSTA